ncbi:MAG: hypothetical protein KatS3mg096_451 [Candidatus Parcubacteria bacterium]|nr:MAG: hypothetical protein KatS3mg096_451 [Candidatus Parcubacteria bacterium]
MMVEKFRPGEQKFIQRFETLHKEKPKTIEETKEKIRYTLEEIKKEIEELPEIRREEEFHETITAGQVTNILAQALDLVINEGVEEGLKFIRKTNNPHLIDQFHDILIGHFLDLLKQ